MTVDIFVWYCRYPNPLANWISSLRTAFTLAGVGGSCLFSVRNFLPSTGLRPLSLFKTKSCPCSDSTFCCNFSLEATYGNTVQTSTLKQVLDRHSSRSFIDTPHWWPYAQTIATLCVYFCFLGRPRLILPSVPPLGQMFCHLRPVAYLQGAGSSNGVIC